MKNILTILVIAAAALIMQGQASAQLKITGTLNPDETRVIIPANHRGGLTSATGVISFHFVSAVGGAILNFCVGPASNPCGVASSFVVTLGPGQESFAVVNNAEFLHGNVLVVGQGTTSSVGFTVEMMQ